MTIHPSIYAVAYNGIFAKVMLAGPIDIGVTYAEAAKLAEDHMTSHLNTKKREVAALERRLKRLKGFK